ncbi:MAG: ATP-binding protein [bacterium]|nr:ATP-binding protein [bacterium]
MAQNKQIIFQRDLLANLIKLIGRKEIFAIRGPRQSGKTTLLHLIKDYLKDVGKIPGTNIVLITLEDRDILEKLENNVKSFVSNIIERADNKHKIYFLIDEVQYLSEAGQKLKLIFDLFNEQVKLIVTGSSSLELKNHTAKYLVGRVFSFNLWPLSFSEFLKVNIDFFKTWEKNHNSVFDFLAGNKNFKIPIKDIWQKDLEKQFEKYVIWGGYPEVIKVKDKIVKQSILKNIYDTYINRDIVDLLRLKSVNSFRNGVKLLAAEVGNLINYNNLANDAQVYFQELKQYISILEETYILYFLKPYFKNATSEIKKNPKVYFIDSGLRNYIVNNFNPLSQRSDKGALVESFVFSELLKVVSDQDQGELKYWRTIVKAEVDFILEKRNREVIPIEVKYSPFQEAKISRSFRSFLEQYQPKRALVLTKGFWGEKKIGKTTIKFAPVWYL